MPPFSPIPSKNRGDKKMIVCNQCKKELTGEPTISIREKGRLPGEYKRKSFCSKECLLIHYDQPIKLQNKFFEKFSGKKKQNIQERIDIAAEELKTNNLGGSEIELGKPLV
jgi:hypothetical protein